MFTKARFIALFAATGLIAAACATTPRPTADFQDTPFQDWSDARSEYILYPGDALEMTVYSAPSLSRTLTVAPDGRIHPPHTHAILAAGRTVDDVEAELLAALDDELLSPELDLRPASFASQRVFVGGEVANPGVYEIPGDIGALEAVMMAGGWQNTSDPSSVMILRRGANGGAMMRQVDLLGGHADPAHADITVLQRFDVVYVPRSGIAEFNLFVRQYLREALPIDFGLYYDLNR